MLDTEATVVLGQIGRMPSDRMLLMAGLMLADKTAAQEDELKSLQAKIAAQDKALRSAEERLADRARRIAELQEAGPRTELPDSVTDGLAELAARAEALADEIEGSRRSPRLRSAAFIFPKIRIPTRARARRRRSGAREQGRRSRAASSRGWRAPPCPRRGRTARASAVGIGSGRRRCTFGPCFAVSAAQLSTSARCAALDMA
jgi:cell division protein ZapA